MMPNPATAVHRDQLRFDKLARFLPADTQAVEQRYKPHVLALLRAAGFPDLQVGVCRARDPVDLVVNGHPVELKIARPRRKAGYNGQRRSLYFQALLRDPHNGHHLNGDFVLLVCVLEAEICPFVIPIAALGERRTVEITSDPFTYAGQWARYRGRFDLLR